MALLDIHRWVARHRSSLYLAAGLLLVGYAALNALTALSDTSYQAYEDVLGPAGFALGFLGLLGIVPELDRRYRGLLRVGVGCLLLGTVGFGTISVANALDVAGVVPPVRPLLTPILVGMATLGFIPGYLAIATASLRANDDRRRLGLLLLGPPLIFGAMLVQAVLFSAFGVFSPERMLVGAVFISAGQALAHLAIGATLRADARRVGHDAPNREVATT